MLFNSFPFIAVFLPCVLILFFAAGRYSHQGAILVLIAASLGFYGYWKIDFLPLLVGSIAGNYAAARLILRWQGEWRGKAVLIGAIATDLGVLGWFKYYNFFAANLIVEQHLEQVFGQELLVTGAERHGLRRLDEAAGAFGVFLDVHAWISLVSARADRP